MATFFWVFSEFAIRSWIGMRAFVGEEPHAASLREEPPNREGWQGKKLRPAHRHYEPDDGVCQQQHKKRLYEEPALHVDAPYLPHRLLAHRAPAVRAI